MKTSMWVRFKRWVRYIANEIWLGVQFKRGGAFERNVRKCRILQLPDIIHNPCEPKKQTPEQIASDRCIVRKLVARISSSDSLH